MKTIEIIVTREGKTSVQTKGFSGASCRDASQFIEQALGKVAEDKLTAEFYQTESVRESQQQRL
jgi:hypothetical protein